MRSVSGAAILLVVTVAGGGCVIKGGAGSLQPRAAFDLQCPESQIQVTELSGCTGIHMGNQRCTMGASGCGRTGTYIDVDGNWVMNSSTNSPAGK